MSGRELVVLGTSSRAPTRERNTNGYLLRWEGSAILIDPGEGTQRQLARAGTSPHHVTHICLTHLHGDHCLGLPGVLEELGSEPTLREIPVHFPARGMPYVERLCHASAGRRPPVRLAPVDATDAGEVEVDPGPPLRISARRLVHPVDTVGYRFEEPARGHLVPARLAAAGITGPAIKRLEREGAIVVDGRRVTLDEMSEVRPGFRVAVVMDTALCPAAVELARDVDLLVCEATFLDRDADLAAAHGHLTARQAASVAAQAGARTLLLTHFSDRYDDAVGHEQEAREVFRETSSAEDLQVVPLVRRPRGGPRASAPGGHPRPPRSAPPPAA